MQYVHITALHDQCKGAGGLWSIQGSCFSHRPGYSSHSDCTHGVLHRLITLDTTSCLGCCQCLLFCFTGTKDQDQLTVISMAFMLRVAIRKPLNGLK